MTRYETTVGRALLSEILPAGLPFELINKALKKKEISKLINAAFRRCGLRETVIFADKLMYTRLLDGDPRRSFDRGRRHARAEAEGRDHRRGREGSAGDREAVHERSRDAGRALQQGGRHLGPRRRPRRESDDGAAFDRARAGVGREVGQVRAAQGRERPAGHAGVAQLDLHDGGLRRARFGGADPAARRHARSHGEAGRLDHRDADHGELPRRPERAAVLHLDARRAQRSCRYRAEDRELGLPHAASGRRDAGSRGDRGRLRHDAGRRDEGADRRRRSGRIAARAHPRPRCGRRHLQPRKRREPVRSEQPARRGRGRRDRSRGHRRSESAHAAHVRDASRSVREVLRPRSRPRRAGERRRSGRRHRRAVDRRAGHAAHDAHVPHRRRGVADGGGEPGRKQVERRGALRRRHALRHQPARRAGRDFAQRRSRDPRREQPRARASQGAVRRDAAGARRARR